jgi:hypothetical protein
MRLGRGVLRLMDAFCGNQNDQRGLDVRKTLDLGSSVSQYSLLIYARVWPLPQLDTTTVAGFKPGVLQAGPRRHPLLILGSSDAEVGKTAQLPFAN